MESAVSRPVIELEPSRTRPGLALALALLSVPGSTIAWELPAGGFWIGLPLAGAAIALGLQARRAGAAMASAAIVISGLMIAMMVVWFTVETVS